MRPQGFLLSTGLLLALVPRPAHGQPSTLDEDELGLQRPPPAVSTDLLDPDAHTRFHLVTRASFESGGETFGGGGSVWVFEPQLMVGLAPWIAVGGSIPMVLDALDRAGDPLQAGDQFVLGNVRLSGVAATSLALDPEDDGYDAPRLHFGLGLDVYLPTHTDEGGVCESSGLCRSALAGQGLRAYEPALFTPDALLARFRGQLAFSVVGVRVAFEGGLVPGWYIGGPFEADALVGYAFAARLHYTGLRLAVPFVELVGSGTVEAPDRGGPPFGETTDRPDPIQLTTGVRAFVEQFAPALFVTFDFDRETVFFGLDVAGVLRSAPSRGEGERLRMGL